MDDLDVNGPKLGELLDFPQRWEWSSIRAMMDVVWQCKIMYSKGATFEEVDTYWRKEFTNDKKN
jgi:hypothetical protein